MTEDLLEEQSEVLAKLGTSAEGAHLRARMQSACLLSDMESFKVALRGHSCDITLTSSQFSWALLMVSKLFFSTKQFQVENKNLRGKLLAHFKIYADVLCCTVTSQ